MFTYRKIVFGLRNRERDFSRIMSELLPGCSWVISEHNADLAREDEDCGRPGVHCHGIVESSFCSELAFHKSSVFCSYFSWEKCSEPAEFLAWMTLPPKRVVAQAINNPSKIPGYLKLVTRDYQLQVQNNERIEKMKSAWQCSKVVEFVNCILKSGILDLNMLQNRFIGLKSEECSVSNFNIALQISRQMVLNSSVLNLCALREESSDYLSLSSSVEFIFKWCKFQNINVKEFTVNWIQCLDKKVDKRNCIYLHGAPNSGKSYVTKSMINACMFVESINQETTGYTFVWQNCPDKRLVVMNEPYFDIKNCEQLETILEGSGTIIYKPNGVPAHLQPTPIVILSNNHHWKDNPDLRRIGNRFIRCYENLKTLPANFLPKLKLHPGWLSYLNQKFTGAILKEILLPPDQESSFLPGDIAESIKRKLLNNEESTRKKRKI